MKMRRSLKPKGFINIPRRLSLYLKEKVFDFSDYGYYIFLLQEADWFQPRKTFGCVTKTNIELAIDSGCNPSTIGRRNEKLEKCGLISKTEEGYIKINQFEKFTMSVIVELSKMDVASLQEDIAQTQEVIANRQLRIAESQKYRQENNDPFRHSPLRDKGVINEEYIDPNDIPF